MDIVIILIVLLLLFGGGGDSIGEWALDGESAPSD